MIRGIKVIGVLSVLLLASGCAQLAAGVVNQVAIATIDNKVSDALDRDCNSYRFVRGGHYCEEKAFVNPGPELYCHKTLGAVECYRKPDPYNVEKSGRTVPPSQLATPTYEAIKRQADANRERLRRRYGEPETDEQEPDWRVPEERKPQNVSNETDI